MPRGIASELLYLGELISAEEVRRFGLVNHVVPGERFADEALDL